MIRSDREVKDILEIVEIIKKCDVCRLALNDNNYPYIVPLNFGFTFEEGKIKIYFHSALKGTKLDLIKKDNRASFEMDCEHTLQYFEDKGYCTMAYESVIGRGKVRILDEEEKLPALKILMRQYHNGKDVYFSEAAVSRTCVYCLEVDSITAKRKVKK